MLLLNNRIVWQIYIFGNQNFFKAQQKLKMIDAVETTYYIVSFVSGQHNYVLQFPFGRCMQFFYWYPDYSILMYYWEPLIHMK